MSKTQKAETPKEESPERVPPSFTVEQLLRAKCFATRKDALTAALKSDRRYTVAEAKAALEKFLERKV